MININSVHKSERSCENAPDQEAANEILNEAKVVQGMILKFQM